MNSLQFRPSLESMDGRIVPDAAPIGAPGPQPAQAEVAPPPRVVPPDSGSEQALRERVTDIDKRIADLVKQFTAITVQIQALQDLSLTFQKAGNGAGVAACTALINGFLAQQDAILARINFYIQERNEILKWLPRDDTAANLSPADFFASRVATA